MSTSSPCPCDAAPGPQVVHNAPNLPTIAYRVGDFTAFREALLQSLPGETALAGWQPIHSDLGLQVLEWWAYLADILTLYNEQIANETYLGTAQLGSSVNGLAALLGYRPTPGIAATGRVAAVRSAKNQREPLVIAAGTQFANQATPGVPVKTYEALVTQTFTSPVSGARVVPPADASLPHSDPATGQQSVLLAGRVAGVAAGDSLLLIRRDWDGRDQNWAQVTVASTAPEKDLYGATNTRVTFSAIAWGLQTPPPQPRLSINVGFFQDISTPSFAVNDVFGSSGFGGFGELFLDFDPVEIVTLVDPLEDDPPPAPPEHDPQVGDYRLVRLGHTAELWSADDGTTVGAYANGTFGVRLSAVSRALSAGDPVLFTDGSTGGAVLGVIAGVSQEVLTVPYPGSPPPKPPTIPMQHTVLTLTLPSVTDADSLVDLSATATVVRYGLRDVGRIIPSPASAMPALPATFTAAVALPAMNAALAYLEDATGTGIPVSATTNADGSSVTLAAATGTPASPSLRLPVQLLIDLLTVSQGSTVASEVLGTGNATVANQSFTLAKSPLTYLAQAASYASTLQIAVDGIYWTEVDSVFGQAPDGRVFTVTHTADGAAVVRFGDGLEGARLPTGSQVVATYRYGSGAATPPAGRLTTILKPQTNLASIRNPVAVAGGADPEPPSSIRSAAPASVLTFGRAISADDYVTIAQQTPGVARARAYWTWDADAQRAMIKIYVGDDDAAAGLATAALTGSDDPNRPVLVLGATPIKLSISCGLVVAAGAVADDVIAAAAASLDDLFAPHNMAIGQRLYSSQIEQALMVPGAMAVQGLQVLEPGRIRRTRWRFFERWLGLRLDLFPPILFEPELFSGPVASADPGEGAFYTLSGTPSIAHVAANG